MLDSPCCATRVPGKKKLTKSRSREDLRAMNSPTQREKDLFATYANRSGRNTGLEVKLQSELHHTRAKRATGFAKNRTAHIVVCPRKTGSCQRKVSAVEHVESRRFKLQANPLRQLESLGHGRVSFPRAGTDKLIAPQISHAAQARRRKGRDSRVRTGGIAAAPCGWVAGPAICPLRSGRVECRYG